jgi:hypothetical protein
MVEHLTDDLTTYAGVAAALLFHECRQAVLIEEQVVDGPPAKAAFVIWYPGFVAHNATTRSLVTVPRSAATYAR